MYVHMAVAPVVGVLTAGDDGGNIYLYNLNVALKIKSSTSCLLQPSAVGYVCVHHRLLHDSVYFG